MEILFSDRSDKACFEMRGLSLDELRTLSEVITLGNFSAVGRRLSLIQPAVNLHVRGLEQRFGLHLILWDNQADLNEE